MPKRPLALPFLNKLDDYLLKNRPDTWTTRVHLVLYYTLLYSVALSLFCLVIPDNPLRDSYVGYFITSQSVLVIVAVVVWVVYLVRFNTFKSYGITYGGDRLKTYFSYFLAIVCMIGTIFIPPVIESYKTMIHYSPSQIVKDMDAMNILLARLTKENYPAELTVDTIYITNGQTMYNSGSGSYIWVDSLGAYTKQPIYMTRDELSWTLSDEDSVVWERNDKLIRYQVTSLKFISNYRSSEDKNNLPLTNFQIYNRVYKSGGTPLGVQELERQFYDLSQKYRDPANEYDNYWGYSSDAYSYVGSRYKTGQVDEGISNILSRYYRWRTNDLVIAYHVVYYIAMFLGLFLFIFRHSTIRTFFLSVLTGIILAIITGIIGALADIREEGAVIIAFLYFLFFFIFAVTTVNWKVRSIFTGIALNLAMVCTPFLPLLGVALYYEITPIDYSPDLVGYYDYDYSQYYEKMHLHYYLAELFGFVVLLILLETAYKWMYRRWYAAPEE